MKSCITTDKLSAGYSGVTVFRDIDLEIPMAPANRRF